jgi:hypothetical protein
VRFFLLIVLAASCGNAPAASCPSDLPAACPTPTPSFARDVNPILQARCAGCHGPSGLASDRPLTTYQEVHAQRSSALNQTYACRMPPADSGGPLTGAERSQVLGWFVCGAPNN